MKIRLRVLAAFLAFAPLASAQEGFYFPGSVWNSTGTLSPVEKGNVISMTHVEQGVAFRGVEAFGHFTGMYDSKGYSWNRRTTEGIGVRFTQSLKGGMVRGGASYVTEQRYVLAPTKQGASGIVLSVDCYFGWKGDR